MFYVGAPYRERPLCMRILKGFANLKIFIKWERKGIKVKYPKFHLLIIFFNSEKATMVWDDGISIGIKGRF